MTHLDIAYSEGEWLEATGHRPLRDLTDEDLALLHRHWMWSNQVREVFDETLKDEVHGGPAMLSTRGFGFMFLWYGLLWAVIEACIDPKEERNLDLRGRFRADIDALSTTLQQFRNAVLHVPRNGEYVDRRLEALVMMPQSALALRRIALGFGRMFLEEFAQRGGTPPVEPPSPAS